MKIKRVFARHAKRGGRASVYRRRCQPYTFIGDDARSDSPALPRALLLPRALSTNICDHWPALIRDKSTVEGLQTRTVVIEADGAHERMLGGGAEGPLRSDMIVVVEGVVVSRDAPLPRSAPVYRRSVRRQRRSSRPALWAVEQLAVEVLVPRHVDTRQKPEDILEARAKSANWELNTRVHFNFASFISCFLRQFGNNSCIASRIHINIGIAFSQYASHTSWLL